MKILVGLGNPGKEYEKTRHNTGALLVDWWRQKQDFPAWKMEKKFRGLVSRGKVHDKEVMLLLPQTFMNLSGESVAAGLNFYRLSAEKDLLVVYDDLDLEFGRYKMSRQAPHGHNGINDIVAKVKSADFAQARVGIDGRGGERKIKGMDYVLMTYNENELQTLKTEIAPLVWEEWEKWL